MRLAIVGSRDFPDEAQVRRYVQGLPSDTVVVSGGAAGTDDWAADEARRRGLEVRVIFPELGQPSRVAPRDRNRAIIADCDELIAFWGPVISAGTSHAVSLAAAAGKLGEVVRPRVRA